MSKVVVWTVGGGFLGAGLFACTYYFLSFRQFPGDVESTLLMPIFLGVCIGGLLGHAYATKRCSAVKQARDGAAVEAVEKTVAEGNNVDAHGSQRER